MKNFFFLSLIFYPLVSVAFPSTGVTKITDIFTYTEYGGGDVTIQVAIPLAGCESGFWMKKSDPGFSANLALIMSAKVAQSDVVIYANSDLIWTGSSGRYCKIYGVNVR